MNKVQQRATNAMIGLAIGDALSWTSLFHRSMLLPLWTRRIRREIDASSEKTNVMITPMPFSLNQNAEHFRLGPTGNTEWGTFSAEILLNSNIHNYQQSVYDAWMTLASKKETIRGGISTQGALKNLSEGITPPESGKRNPHYFDDGAMIRAIPIGIRCSGQPELAAKLAGIDASITNGEDGIWAAQSIAAAVSAACSGKSLDDVIAAAILFLPNSSWIKRTVDEALIMTKNNNSLFSVLPDLHNTIINREYSYGNVAPETLALALAIVQIQGDQFATSVTSATALAKSGETLPSIVGALAGAMSDKNIAEGSWRETISSLKGICLPDYSGNNYLAVVENLARVAGQDFTV